MAALISTFSTHYFSGEETARVIIPIIHHLFPFATPRELRWMYIGIRKLAHVTEFGVFSIAVFHGIRGPRPGWNWKWALVTLMIVVSYAGLDEWLQPFVALWKPRGRDVLIDLAGAILAQVFVWGYAKLHDNEVDPAGSIVPATSAQEHLNKT